MNAITETKYRIDQQGDKFIVVQVSVFEDGDTREFDAWTNSTLVDARATVATLKEMNERRKQPRRIVEAA